jgi:hypothetical protein
MAETKQACSWLIDAARRDPSVGPGQLPAFKYPVGAMYYQLAELHRVRGELADAESWYQEASAYGLTIEPGLALLRLAQGKLDRRDC